MKLITIVACSLQSLIALGTMSVATAAQGADVLDEYLSMQLGSFTSEAQAKQDARYDVATWHIAEIWPEPGARERWTYTESWLAGAPVPYMQRVTRLQAQPDGSIATRRYAIPEAGRFVGAWRDPKAFERVKPAELTELHGCDAVLTRAGAGRFEGGTLGSSCGNSYKGASYAISQSVLTADEMVNWDRGFDSAGNLRWGPAAGGSRRDYRQVPVPRSRAAVLALGRVRAHSQTARGHRGLRGARASRAAPARATLGGPVHCRRPAPLVRYTAKVPSQCPPS